MYKLSCCVAVAVAGLGGAAVAEEYVPGTGWKPFSWLTQNLGGGFINKDPFTFSVPGNCSALLQVTDSEFGGERMEVYHNGSWMGFTTSTPLETERIGLLDFDPDPEIDARKFSEAFDKRMRAKFSDAHLEALEERYAYLHEIEIEHPLSDQSKHSITWAIGRAIELIDEACNELSGDVNEQSLAAKIDGKFDAVHRDQPASPIERLIDIRCDLIVMCRRVECVDEI